jgi:uncharacterized protein with von Willebrand factor type A (vWA) domain
MPTPPIGGVIHTYQQYDPLNVPSPHVPPPDAVSGAFEHMLTYGNMRELTDEELARAIHLDPSQIAGLGPSIDMLIAMLEERKRKILEKYETDAVRKKAEKHFQREAAQAKLPGKLRQRFEQAVREGQLYDLERIWYALGDDQSPAAKQMMRVTDALGNHYQVEQLASKYEFTGHEGMTIPQAIEIKEELEQIDELLKQLEEARKTARIAIIDWDLLDQFAPPQDIENLKEMQQKVEEYVKQIAEMQGLERDKKKGGYKLTPKAYKIFQSKLLERIFSELQASKSGRHTGPIVGEGAVEMQTTKSYEFGDSMAHVDLPQTFVNMLLRQGDDRPLRMKADDIVVHKTRNNPKCATSVIMDMSGSMRYDGQYINVKRMALALEGIVRKEYPGDHLSMIEMSTFAKLKRPGEVIEMMPKPVTIYDPVVRLKVDMSNDQISESRIPPHFTNIQQSLQMSRRLLATQDTPNKQIVLITDGLPTAHFEGTELFMLYPPHPRTEQATMREGLQCARDGITINIFLIPSWSQSEEDIRFAYKLAETTKGRVFFTAGRDLDRFVVWDYLQKRREILG